MRQRRKTPPAYHIHIDWTAVAADYEGVSIRILSEEWGGAGSFLRYRNFLRGFTPDPFIVTVPLWTGNVQIIWSGIDLEEPYPTPGQNGDINWTGIGFGADRKIDIPQDTGGE